jgi:hypothetical protein
MKHLKTYKLFESQGLPNQDTLETISDILLDMTDRRINVDIKTSTRRKKSIRVEVQYIIAIVFRGKFKPSDYIATFDHLNNFLEDEGWRYFPDGTCYGTYHERRESFKKDNLLSLLEIKYIRK